jgi:hypothetical protein
MVRCKTILLQRSYAAIAYAQQRSLKTCGKFVGWREKNLNKIGNCHVVDALLGLETALRPVAGRLKPSNHDKNCSNCRV